MTTPFANALALTYFGIFRFFHPGQGNGFIWLIVGVVVVSLIALIFRWVSKRPSD